MRLFTIAAALTFSSCSLAPNSPSLIPTKGLPHFPSTNECLVHIHLIPEVHGNGWTWLQSDTKGNCGDLQGWSIDHEAIYHHDGDPDNIVYFGGPYGSYRVTAKYTLGSGFIDVELVAP